MLILWIISFSLLGSVGAIFTAAIFLRIGEQIQEILVPSLIAYASGTLLTVALMGLIPHAIEHTDSHTILITVLMGIILFFILEKIIIWRHCHETECRTHGTVASMILIGDAFHNAADGVIIATSFLVSIPIGITTAISVIAHEIPQEVGDFAILLNAGYSRKKALLMNTLSSLSTLPVAILAYYGLVIINDAIPYAMAIAAASFLYISLTDLYPELHQRGGFWYEIRQFFFMVLGVGMMLFLLQFHH